MPSECTELSKNHLSTCNIKQISQFIVKKTSIKEIRQRGFQRKNDIKTGVRADQDIKFNDIVGELTGSICSKNDKMEEKDANCYFFDGLDVFVTTKTKGFRKSCRPNCVVKLRKKEEQYYVLVFAIKNIHMNEELTIGFDYGNTVENFKCICNDADFCLLKTK